LIAKAKGGKSRYVPLLPELAQELRTHLGQRTVGYLFETNRATRYSPRRIQYIVKETAEQAQITKRVYPHLLRNASTYCYTSLIGIDFERLAIRVRATSRPAWHPTQCLGSLRARMS